MLSARSTNNVVEGQTPEKSPSSPFIAVLKTFKPTRSKSASAIESAKTNDDFEFDEVYVTSSEQGEEERMPPSRPPSPPPPSPTFAVMMSSPSPMMRESQKEIHRKSKMTGSMVRSSAIRFSDLNIEHPNPQRIPLMARLDEE